MNSALALLATLLLLTAAPALAQEQEAPFLPDPAMINTNDPFPVDPGQLEIQAGYNFSNSDRDFDADGVLQPRHQGIRQHSHFAQFTYGIDEGLDATLTVSDIHGADFGWDPDGDGICDTKKGHALGDTTASVRYQFYLSEDETAAAAVIAALTIPSGPQASVDRLGLSQGFTSLNPRLVASKSWGRFQGVAELGWAQALGTHDCDTLGGMQANLAAGYQIGDWLKPLVELNYGTVAYQGAPAANSLSATFGLLVMLEDVRLNLGVQRSLAGQNSPESTSGFFFVTFSP